MLEDASMDDDPRAWRRGSALQIDGGDLRPLGPIIGRRGAARKGVGRAGGWARGEEEADKRKREGQKYHTDAKR